MTTGTTSDLRADLQELRDLVGDPGFTAKLDAFNTRWRTNASNVEEATQQTRRYFETLNEGLARSDALWGRTITNLVNAGERFLQAGDDIVAAQEKLGEEVRDIYSRMTGFIGGNFMESLHDFGQTSEGFVATTGRTLRSLYEDFYLGDVGIGGATRLFFGEPEEMMKYVDELVYAAGSGLAFINGMREDAARGGRQLDEQMKSTILIARGLGFSSDQMLHVLDRQFSRTGDTSDRIFREITSYSHAVASVTGDSVKAISQGMAEMITDTGTFANVTVESAAKTTAALRQMGLEVADLAGVVNKFLNFDSAAESLANLTTVFGVQIDAMEMMEAASNDPFEAMVMMREAFLDAGVAASDLSIQQKNLIMGQLGLRDVEAVERLFDPTHDIDSIDDLTRATEAVNVDTASEALGQLEDDITRVIETGNDFSEDIANTMIAGGLIPMSSEAAQTSSKLVQLSLDIDRIGDRWESLVSPEFAERTQASLDKIEDGSVRAGLMDLHSRTFGRLAGDAGTTIQGSLGRHAAAEIATDLREAMSGDPEVIAALQQTGQAGAREILEGMTSEDVIDFAYRFGYMVGEEFGPAFREAMGWQSPIPLFEQMGEEAVTSFQSKYGPLFTTAMDDNFTEIEIINRAHLESQLDDEESSLSQRMDMFREHLEERGKSWADYTAEEQAQSAALILQTRSITDEQLAYVQTALGQGQGFDYDQRVSLLNAQLSNLTGHANLSEATIEEFKTSIGVPMTNEEIEAMMRGDQRVVGQVLERIGRESMRRSVETAESVLEGLDDEGVTATGGRRGGGDVTHNVSSELTDLVRSAVTAVETAATLVGDQTITVRFESQGMFSNLLEEFINGAAVTETASGFSLEARVDQP